MNSFVDANDTIGIVESMEVSTRSVVMKDNIIQRTHRGTNATVIKIAQIPNAVLSNLSIANSSSLAFSSTYSSFISEYGSAFANTSLLSSFNSSVISEPGSLIEIGQALWVEMNTVKLLSNILTGVKDQTT